MCLEEQVKATIRRQGLVRQGDRVLVAVSGGPDSVALLHILHGWAEALSLHLEVAHLQHGIRGEEAVEDARFVARLAEKIDLEFHLREIDLPAMRSRAGGNLEELARTERYRFFAEVMRERKLDKTATAHTQDDQAETVLMWLLRGAGMKGLGGMEPLSRIEAGAPHKPQQVTVVRPLLDVSKKRILCYLGKNGLPYRTDRTNQDPAWLRNWLRAELLPQMRRRIGENIAERLSRQAALMREENRFLDQLARERYRAMGRADELDRRMLLSEPEALRRRVVRLWIAGVRGHLRGLDLIHVEQVLHVAEAEAPQGRVSMPGGWEAVREYDVLRLARKGPRDGRLAYCYELPVGKVLRIPEAGVEVSAERLESTVAPRPVTSSEAVFDLEELPDPLLVRSFRPGDRFRPLGMSGRKKIKDLFIDRKVPQRERARWPLLAMGNEILWIPGHGRSALARVIEKTRCVLRIRVVSMRA